jgi:hypothetical protein
MRKVLFTESQMRQILNKVGINESEFGSGYLDKYSNGTEAPANVNGIQVSTNTVDPEDSEQNSITTTDEFGNMQSPRGRGFGPKGLNTMTPVSLEEDIEQQDFIANKFQKRAAKAGGTKMGKNIASEKKTSNATQRKRKERLNNYKQNMSPEEYKKQYGKIEKTVNDSLKQMSNVNNTITNVSDVNKLTNANDATKVKTSTKKGHHDGEQLSNGTLHYFK